MNRITQKKNVAEFNSDIATNDGYQYTTNAPYSSIFANRRITEAIVERIPHDVTSIVDIGCGDGTYTGELAEFFPGIEITGIDPAEEAVARCRRKFPAVNFTVADLLAPGTLPRKIFDVGIIRGVVHHLPDGALGIANAARICNRLIVLEPNGNNPVLKWIERNSRYHIEHEEQSFSSRELESWCRAAGYNRISLDYINFVPMFFPTVPSRIIHSCQPLLERIYPLKKYLAGQIILSCHAE